MIIIGVFKLTILIIRIGRVALRVRRSLMTVHICPVNVLRKWLLISAFRSWWLPHGVTTIELVALNWLRVDAYNRWMCPNGGCQSKEKTNLSESVHGDSMELQTSLLDVHNFFGGTASNVFCSNIVQILIFYTDRVLIKYSFTWPAISLSGCKNKKALAMNGMNMLWTIAGTLWH